MCVPPPWKSCCRSRAGRRARRQPPDPVRPAQPGPRTARVPRGPRAAIPGQRGRRLARRARGGRPAAARTPGRHERRPPADHDRRLRRDLRDDPPWPVCGRDPRSGPHCADELRSTRLRSANFTETGLYSIHCRSNIAFMAAVPTRTYDSTHRRSVAARQPGVGVRDGIGTVRHPGLGRYWDACATSRRQPGCRWRPSTEPPAPRGRC